jgi:hypothetical protein
MIYKNHTLMERRLEEDRIDVRKNELWKCIWCGAEYKVIYVMEGYTIVGVHITSLNTLDIPDEICT